MTYKRGDNEVSLPLIHPVICETKDNSRTMTSLTVTTITAHLTEDYSKFHIQVYSGSQHEDRMALFVAITQFKSWAESKGAWDTPPSDSAQTLFTKWKKRLAGLVSQNWMKIGNRLAPGAIPKTFTLFKKSLSRYNVEKVAHGDDDAYFTQQEYLQERPLPSGMTFNEYYNRLTLFSAYMMCLFDARQIIRLKNVQGAFDFEREAHTLDLLWNVPHGAIDPTGCFDEGQLVAILLQTMPEPWVTQARLQSVTHLTPLRDVCAKIATYCAISRQQNNASNHQYSPVPQGFAFRGGGRHNLRNRYDNRNYG
jgi:hypothetical protein